MAEKERLKFEGNVWVFYFENKETCPHLTLSFSKNEKFGIGNANLIINFSLPYQRPSQLTFLEIDRERVKHLNTFELSKNQKASLELSKHSKFEVKC